MAELYWLAFKLCNDLRANLLPSAQQYAQQIRSGKPSPVRQLLSSSINPRSTLPLATIQSTADKPTYMPAVAKDMNKKGDFLVDYEETFSLMLKPIRARKRSLRSIPLPLKARSR